MLIFYSLCILHQFAVILLFVELNETITFIIGVFCHFVNVSPYPCDINNGEFVRNIGVDNNYLRSYV